MSDETEIWIGLADVVPKFGSDILGTAKGAYVNVLLPARNLRECRMMLHEALEHYGLELQELTELEPLRVRLSNWTVDPDLLILADEASATGTPRFDTFHTYPNEAGPA